MSQHMMGLRRVTLALLPGAIALALAACGGGGGGGLVQPTPQTPPPPGGLGFTPNVANDSALTVNPPTLAKLGAPVVFTDAAINKHLSLTNAAGALGAGLTGSGITIGLVDSGVNRNHPALNGRVKANFIHVDSKTNNTSVDDVVGHGTTVASLAAGRPTVGTYSGGESGNWGGGVAQSANIVASRIIGDKRATDDGSGAGNEIRAGDGYGDFFKGINAELADAGAKIINNSWGGLYWNDPALTLELANAWKDFVVNRGGIVVFANGNSGDDSRYVSEPSDNARLPTLANDKQLEKGWLTVGALDPDNPTQLTSYSQQCGSAMNYCLVAPGNDVFIDPQAKVGDASYKLYQGGGTSYAAPLVAGAAAVVWSAFPYFNNDQVRQALLGGAKDLGAPGVDAVFGWGLLDVTKAAMGPSNFAWGDFSVSFSGNSVWRNEIIGSGGLIKSGSGTLTLTETGKYTGATQVNGGGLDLRKGLSASNLTVASAGTVWGSGTFGGNVANAGRFLSGANAPARITSNFSQTSTGNLGVWLGSALRVDGTASLNGTVSILGVKTGYTTTAKETLLNATGGVSGTFSTLKAAPNVFLDASLGYDPNNVFLNINRIDVSKAVAGMGITGMSFAAATRVEFAMQAIDRQLGGATAGIGSSFIDAAGAFQQATSTAQAEASLRSLSGEMHASSAAQTFDALDSTRRMLNTHLDGVLQQPTRVGGWARDLNSSGQLTQLGGAAMGMDSRGVMIGSDWQVGDHAVAGLAMNRLEQMGWQGQRADQSRGHQREVQFYTATQHAGWQLQTQFALGNFQRQMQRELLLGALTETAATQLSGRYQSAFAELGRRFTLGQVGVIPYLGTHYVRIENDGFAESGSSGFGLRANAWTSRYWQGLAGVRTERGWRFGGVELRADARAEWQRNLATSGALFNASFTGVEQWAPLQGMALPTRSQLYGLGLSARWTPNVMLRFDLSHRAGLWGRDEGAMLWGMYRF